MRVLITGGTGYIGSHFMKAALSRTEWELLSLARRRHDLFEPLLHHLMLDLKDFPAMEKNIRLMRPDVIVHLGAVSSPNEAEKDSATTAMMNVELTRHLCRLASETGAFLIFSSTDLVFGGAAAPQGGFPEDHAVSPYSVYSRSKVEGETMVQALQGPWAVIRIALAYGPPIGSRSGQLGWMQGRLLSGETVPLFYDEWRSPCYVGDIVEVLFRLIETRHSGTFHCGGPDRLSRLEFGTLYAQACGARQDLLVRCSRLDAIDVIIRPQDTTLNSERTARALGIRFTPARIGIQYSVG